MAWDYKGKYFFGEAGKFIPQQQSTNSLCNALGKGMHFLYDYWEAQGSRIWAGGERSRMKY